MRRSIIANRRFRRARLRPTVQGLEARMLLTGGSLDPTFAGGTGFYLGKVSPGVGTGITSLIQTVVESDNSILAAGLVGKTGSQSYGVIHVTADGALDTSFGNGGEADVVLPTGLAPNYSSLSLLIQGDGKFVVVGGVSSATASYAMAARFDADGQPDPTFGASGVEVVNLNTLGPNAATIASATLQSNGEIVLVGDSYLQSTPSNITQIVVLRLEANGTLDTSFGTGGVVLLSDIPPDAQLSQGFLEQADGVVVQASGRIVIVGYIEYAHNGGFVPTPELIRLDSDGSRDNTISQAGITSAGFQYPQGLVQQPDGQLLVLGTSIDVALNGTFGSAGLVRLDANGNLQTVATLPYLNQRAPGPTGIAIQPDGDVALFVNSDSPSYETQPFYATAVILLTRDLTPDPTFGTGGVSFVYVSPPDSPSFSELNGLAVGSNNQIVLVGADVIDSTYAVIRLTTTIPLTPAVPGDYTGDGIADPAIYLPQYGEFAIRPSSGGPDEIIPFGLAGAGQTIPAPGDYTGSGVTEIAAYLPSLGLYAYRPAGGGPDVLQQFGIPGSGQSIPAPGDYFGTGQDDLAVYLPSIGSFAIRNPDGGPDEIIPFGIAGAGQSIPVPGDYDGSGKTELAVYMPSLGEFAYRPADGGPDVFVPFGTVGAGQSIPAPGDYDGSSKTEFAVYLPSQGELAYRPANGGPDVITPFGIAGAGQSIPMPGDYDDSGKTELAVYLPSLGTFAYRPADGGPDVPEPFGIAGTGQTVPVTVVVPPSPQISDLVVAQLVPLPTGMVGQPETFTLTVTNDGPDAATNATLIDTLPTNATFVDAAPSQGGDATLDNGVLTDDLGTIDAGASATLTLILKPTASGVDINYAGVYSPDILAASATFAYGAISIS